MYEFEPNPGISTILRNRAPYSNSHTTGWIREIAIHAGWRKRLRR